MADEEGKDDLRNPDVVTKYRTAGDIVNNALKHVMDQCKAGARILDICVAGDKFIEDAMSKIYKGKKVDKGLGFPTCISVNNIVGHFSPMQTDETVLAAGDMAKLDIGAHVDGFIAVAATTLIVGEEGPSTEPATGPAGDLLAAIYNASEGVIRMLKIGGKNTPITEMISKVAEDFKVTPVRGVLSHQLEKFLIDGPKTIICKSDTDQKVDEIEFEPNEVYAIDIVMSTGDGKPKELGDRSTTVFKRMIEETYQLKMKASRAVLSDISKRFPTFPFALRNLDSKTGAFGIKECVTRNLVRPYPVLSEKEGDLVAHVKFTALLMPNGTVKVSDAALTPAMFVSEYAVTDEELKKLLASSVASKKKKKKNKKKKKAAEADTAE